MQVVVLLVILHFLDKTAPLPEWGELLFFKIDVPAFWARLEAVFGSGGNL